MFHFVCLWWHCVNCGGEELFTFLIGFSPNTFLETLECFNQSLKMLVQGTAVGAGYNNRYAGCCGHAHGTLKVSCTGKVQMQDISAG